MAGRNKPVLTAHLLGTFRVTVNGVLVDTESSRRNRNVLAYLLAHRRAAVPRDVLMAAFWPDAEPRAARNNLHVALSGIRQALRAAHSHQLIERRFDSYRIAEAATVWTDVEEFERHCEAARRAERAGDHASATRHYEASCQLYEDDFLVDEPYLDWAAVTRDALRLQAMEAQSRLVDAYLDRAQHGPATVLARRILAADPCNEPVHRQLMICYAEAGQRHLALTQYHRLAATLWELLRVRPSTETTALYEALRRPERLPA
jgi:DNA-binding SARP family transcriptional activator